MELFQVFQMLLFTVYCVHGEVPGLLKRMYCLLFTELCPKLFQVCQILLFTVHCVLGAVPDLSNLTFYSVLCPWSCVIVALAQVWSLSVFLQIFLTAVIDTGYI